MNSIGINSNNEITIFKNAEFGEVRTVVIDGEPWFVGKDVASILGYSNHRDALAKRVDSEDKGVANCDSLGGNQEMTVINESGIYSLVLSSKLPTAKKFKRWVTSEILPTIRKYGAYLTDSKLEEALLNPDTLIHLATQIKQEREKNRILTIENETLVTENEELRLINNGLTAETLYWNDRQSVNRAIRIIASKKGDFFARVWNDFYDELLYKHHISLKRRGNRPYIQHIRPDEWSAVQQTLVAICENSNLDTAEILKCSKIQEQELKS